MGRNLFFVLVIFLPSCSWDEGENWREIDGGDIVYNMCFWKHGLSDKTMTKEFRHYRGRDKLKLSPIPSLDCDGLILTIPKDDIDKDTKILAGYRATVSIDRPKIGLAIAPKEKSNNTRISISPIRWWEKSHDSARGSINSYFSLYGLEPSKTLSSDFEVYRSESSKSPIFYTPPLGESDIFIHCYALFPWPDLPPEEGRCMVSSNINNLMHIKYQVYRKDIPLIRDINKNISSYLQSYY